MYFSGYLLADLFEYARIKGADEEILYERSGYSKGEVLTPSTYISYDIMVKVLQLVMEQTGDEQLGLHLGEEMSLKATSYVDQMMAASPSLEEAFQNAATYSKMISDALESHLEVKEDKFIVSFGLHPEWALQAPNTMQQIIDLSLVSTFKALYKLTSKNYSPFVLHLPYPKPKKINEYYRIFNCSVKFNQPYAALVFQQYIFKQSLKSKHAGLLESLTEQAELALKKLQGEPQIVHKLKKIILRRKPEKITVKEVAQELSLPPRTLQRKLKTLNTSFKEIEFDLQIRLAKNYLQSTDKSIDEISYVLGFSESSSFIRFFKSMTQLTPKKYRLEQIKFSLWEKDIR